MVAANWKMHGDSQSVLQFAEALETYAGAHESQTLVFAPPSPYLQSAALIAKHFAVAGQNGHEKSRGAHTGDVSMSMLRDVGCRYVIIGHSERRGAYGESDKLIIDKLLLAFESGLIPILCIGENALENADGVTMAVLTRQLQGAMEFLDESQKKQLVIAYEPVWAIGSGKTPDVADIGRIHEKIRYVFAENNAIIADSLRILYGGSVNPENAKQIFALPDVDGGLVGGASLTFDSFQKIIKAL